MPMIGPMRPSDYQERLGRGPFGGKLWPDSRREHMGSLVKKRRKKMSKHKYRKRLRANRHKRK